MVASSLSTYLDVTQAASESRGTGDPGLQEVDKLAKVLAAVHAGTNVASELPAQTGFGLSDVMAALSALSRAHLVLLSQGDEHVELTERAKASLSQT